MSPAIKARGVPRGGDVWRIGRAGGTLGANADFPVGPETGWSVVVLANRDPPASERMSEV